MDDQQNRVPPACAHEPDRHEWAMFEKVCQAIEPLLRPLPATV